MGARHTLADQASYSALSSASSPSGRAIGWIVSSSPRLTGKMWQIGSFFSNRSSTLGRVKTQFMVKLNGIQSVSTTPLRP